MRGEISGIRWGNGNGKVRVDRHQRFQMQIKRGLSLKFIEYSVRDEILDLLYLTVEFCELEKVNCLPSLKYNGINFKQQVQIKSLIEKY